MNDPLRGHDSLPHPALPLRDELKTAVATALPQTPEQFGAQLIREKWGQDIDPDSALLVTLDYDTDASAGRDAIHQGRVNNSRTLVQALLSNYQTVADGRFGETAFGLYTPPDIGPDIHVVGPVDDAAAKALDYYHDYEGIYRSTTPQTYGPSTQIALRPADFKKWVWELELQCRYQAYLDQAWPSAERIVRAEPYALRTSVKAAFVMSACLQHQEGTLSRAGLALAMQAAGLPAEQTWEALAIAQLQAPTRVGTQIETGRLTIYRYTSSDIWFFRQRSSARVLLYVPANSSPLHEFADIRHMRDWVVAQGRNRDTQQALASHFAEEDRDDGTFHAGVLTALEGLAAYPNEYRLKKTAGFFNNDGFWDPQDYIDFERSSAATDPFAQLVLTMRQAAMASVKTIRDDAQVNRDNLSAVVEPLVRWINQFGPLALFVPGGEGLLVLAGIIDAGYGLDQAVNGKTPEQRSEGITRTVFGLLNALPLAGAGAALKGEGSSAKALGETLHESGEPVREPGAHPLPDVTIKPEPVPATPVTRLELMRGVCAPLAAFSDEVLAQIGKVSAVDEDMLRLMQAGRAPTPLLADTIERFRIDQEVSVLGDSLGARTELFNQRYQALQQSEHEWVRLFQRQYPGLPKAAVEQMLDRHGIDFKAQLDVVEAKRSFKQLDSKARQYQKHVRLNRAYEGLYLRSVANPESDILAMHSLKNLPGWPKNLRIEVFDGSPSGRVLDRGGLLEAPDCRRLIKVGEHYQPYGFSTRPFVGTPFHEAIVGVLSEEERAALQLSSNDPVAGLKLGVSEYALSRPELVLGLDRMDSGLPFEALGLRGGGYPDTPREGALTQAMMRMQLKEIYPEFSDDEVDGVLRQLGSGAQAYIDSSRLQLLQLYTDLQGWLDQVAVDIDDMDVPFLQMGDPGTEGLTPAQIELRNTELLQDVMAYEGESRYELGEELVAIWQKRAPQHNSHYSGDHRGGFTIDMSHEDYHRLPVLNVRFNDVVELNLNNFHLTEPGTLNGFLECFPDLRRLNMEGTDLRLTDIAGQVESALPSTIPQLQHLVSLNLRSTRLTFQENTAAQLSQLVNLQSLDLSENPLGVPPMVLGMNQLRMLKLNNTGITTCPVGVMEQPYLTTLDLRHNRIHRVPQAVLSQAIARDRVLLWNNPLTDEDTLQRLVRHREQTGINLWLSTPGPDYMQPSAWLHGIEEAQRDTRLQVWQRLALRPRGRRFLETVSSLALTADFRVDYPDLQARVWRLLTEADASQELWGRLTQDAPLPAGAFDNPFAAFTALEDRAKLYSDWVALGRPFPIPESGQ